MLSGLRAIKMGKYIFNSQFGECTIEVKGERISIVFEDSDLGVSEAELAMQEYCNLYPQGGKFGNNEVQKSEEFEGEFVSEIY